MKQLFGTLALVCILFAFAPTASAAVTTVPPFAGTFSETWETFANYTFMFHIPDPSPIMGGTASISGSPMLIYEPPGAPLSLGGYDAMVADGSKAMALDGTHIATIAFATPISDFGAFWGASTSLSTVSVSFFDSSDVMIGSDMFVYAAPHLDGELLWHGWHSDIPVSSIRYSGSYVATDGLQANPVPEPETLLLLLAALPLAPFLRGKRGPRN